MYDDQPTGQPRPPAPAEPHESGPPTPPRTCAYANPCECRPSGFCRAMMTSVVNMLERGR